MIIKIWDSGCAACGAPQSLERVATLLLIGNCELDDWHYEAAIFSYSAAIKLDPDNAEIYRQKAEAFYENDDIASSTLDWSRVIDLIEHDDEPSEDELYEAYRTRANLHNEQGFYDLAIDDYDYYISNFGYTSLDLYWRAGALVESGRLESAISDYSTVIDACTPTVEDWCLEARAKAYLCIGEYHRAIDDYSELIERKKISYPSALGRIYFDRAVTYYEAGRYNEAFEGFTTAIELNPDRDDAYEYQTRARDAGLGE